MPGARKQFSRATLRLPSEAPRVEGNITATARFQGEESGLDLTPDTEPEIQFSVRIRELPEVRFTRSGGVVRAGDEIELGLGLVGPYAEAIVGSLWRSTRRI